MIGIIGAMGLEVEALRARLEEPETRVFAGMDYVSGRLCGREAVVARCGEGKVNAAVYTQIMLDRYPVSALLHTGIAGGLAPGLRHLTPVVADRLAAHDLSGDVRHACWPFTPFFETDPRLRALLLRAAGPEAVCGTVVTGDRFISSAADKAELRARLHAVCAEMEGAAVAQACFVNKVPFAVLRCISDLADDAAHGDYERFERLAADKAAGIVLRAMEEI